MIPIEEIPLTQNESSINRRRKLTSENESISVIWINYPRYLDLKLIDYLIMNDDMEA